MRKTILRKLRGSSGETLAEVLVSLLIVVLAVMLLASMVTTSGRMDIATREKDEQFYRELTDAETQVGALPSPETYTPKIVIEGAKDYRNQDITIPVDLYGGDDVTSYTVRGGSN